MPDSAKKKAWHARYMKEMCSSDKNTHKIRHAGKTHEISWDSTYGNTDISHLKCLEGRKVFIKVAVDTHDVDKTGIIKTIYPHCAKVEYQVGKFEGHQHTLVTCLSTADLITMGIISFATGKPEVVNL